MAASERVSRSFALEQTYVHEVYEQYYDNPRSKPWPKVQEFLEKLEPGALVCDVGCGNGKYLKVNKSIYNLGGEKSNRLSDLARQKQNEVIRLDNLALPFKDNCFDTVLSLSVIHHFATTDRRVSSLREMARVLRVGGRMIITVWAMEQDHRKFESQDVLVPWRRPRFKASCGITTGLNSADDIQNPYHSYTQSDSDSNKSFRFRNTFKRKTRNSHQRKQRPLEAYRKTSSGSSTLSSPSETCYGFVRRALQKIAGGSRRVVANSWFLDNWIACMHKQQPLQKRYDPDGCEYCDCSGCDNVEDQPIELLRIDDEEPKQIPRRQTCPVSQMSADIDAFKSKSMNNIGMLNETNNNRCRLSKAHVDDSIKGAVENPVTPASVNSLKKPKLVKQKKSLCEEDADEALDQPTDMKDLVRAMPDFKSGLTRHQRGGVLKQRSLNEEILSTDRLREKERLKQNIQKQTSLNEDLIYKRAHTFESLRESFFAVASTKSFQMLKDGLTNRIKNSTTMEKVASASLKNGFVKIFQTWKGAELKSPTTRDNESYKNVQNCHPADKEPSEKSGERRHSKEDGSDSSKDSSLQSDTSVDSEDSFASVIFVPKSDPMSPIGGASLSAGPTSPLLRGGCQSAPQSPRIKQSSCPTSPRVKQLHNGIHPLTKQLSSPKPSTELLSTVTEFFPVDDKLLANARLRAPAPKLLPVQPAHRQNTQLLAQNYSVQPIPQFRRTTLNSPSLKECFPFPPQTSNQSSVLTEAVPTANMISPVKPPPDAEASRTEKLKKIREMLAQKPGFGSKSKSHCPIVRKISDPDKKEQSLAKPIPQLLKLDIFNPEVDDDSDNSCVSSPDSIGSVNRIKASGGVPAKADKFNFPDTNRTGNSMSLLEAAANVASSLDEAVEKVISSRPTKKLPKVDVFSILHRRFSSSDTTPLLDEEEEEGLSNGESRRSSNTWNEECHKHLTAFADKLSEKLMKELDEYQLTMDNIDDPYIHRLSEELHDLSILSEEIKKQNEYLTRLSQTNHPQVKKSCTKCKSLEKCRCVIETRTSDRTKNYVSMCNATKPLSQNHKALPCVNNSVNPVLNSFSKSIRFNGSGVNGNNDAKFDEDYCGKRVENGGLGYCAEVDQFNGPDVKREQNRPVIANGSSSESFDSSDKGSSSNSLLSSGATSINFGGQSVASSVTDLTGDSRDGCSNGGSTASLTSTESKGKGKFDHMDTLSPGHLRRRDPSGLSDISADSWPADEIGGEITYHRYYHVFRQGELEKLIEKYVDDLHVVSSTYQHASWCIIAEKVQIWTI
uniref:Methyltransferase type 11 domain-containing protein n=1 Tax=Dendroctonus ponderosae TaxID=77166 RepID=A0AAR5PKU7_DENPD